MKVTPTTYNRSFGCWRNGSRIISDSYAVSYNIYVKRTRSFYTPNFLSQADEYFLFAGLIGVATTLFAVLANRYEYVDETEFTSKESNGVDATDESMNLDDENDTALSNGAH